MLVVVDHGVVVVPEHVVRPLLHPPQLAGDGQAVPQGDVFVPRAEDGGPWRGHRQPEGESSHPGPGGGLERAGYLAICYQGRVWLG